MRQAVMKTSHCIYRMYDGAVSVVCGSAKRHLFRPTIKRPRSDFTA